ncbi:MAG: hypothetical protein Q8Q89_00665 [bacterium]|nr:hypothetical protein [bacterium]
MIKGELKKILWEVFDVLGFYENEKERALEGFKKKFAYELLKATKDSLPEEQQKLATRAIENKEELNRDDPNVISFQKVFSEVYPEKKLSEIGKQVFGRILSSYVDFMSSDLSEDDKTKLKEITDKLN